MHDEDVLIKAIAPEIQALEIQAATALGSSCSGTDMASSIGCLQGHVIHAGKPDCGSTKYKILMKWLKKWLKNVASMACFLTSQKEWHQSVLASQDAEGLQQRFQSKQPAVRFGFQGRCFHVNRRWPRILSHTWHIPM